jgi:hypothetical protein
MQDFIDQASKNGVILSNYGKCQCCGADYPDGIFGCMNHYNAGTELLDFSNPEYHHSRFLSVDAHALQHPEIHGRWSNHFHLTRLCLLLEKKTPWDYQKSPLLSAYLNDYKVGRPDEYLTPPRPMQRGNLTMKDLSDTKTAAECVEQIRQWATEVYEAWHKSHSIVRPIAEGFLEKNPNR